MSPKCEWKRPHERPPHNQLLELIFNHFDPNVGATLGYVIDGRKEPGEDGKLRWYTLYNWLGLDGDGLRYWRLCPCPRAAIELEIEKVSLKWRALVEGASEPGFMPPTSPGCSDVMLFADLKAGKDEE